MASLYNQGNAMMQQNNHEEAAKYYKEALKLSPADSALRKNYEIAMLKDKEKSRRVAAAEMIRIIKPTR